MSHFAVMVLGQNVEQQLAPYHEFECTGRVDEYVQSIDKLEEARADYEECTRNMLRGPEGELVSPYDDQFYRDPTEEEAEKIGPVGGFGHCNGICYSSKDWGDGKGRRAKVQYVPEGWERVEVHVKEFQSLLQYILDDHCGEFPVLKEGDEPDLHEEHKWGWVRVNADNEVIEYIDRTNPNKKWDWWVVGGRWSNTLKLKDTREGLKVVRDESLPAGMQVGLEVGPVHRDGDLYVDQALKRDIDMEGMRNEAGIEAAAKWDKAAEAKIAAGFAADTTWDAWPVVLERHPDNVQAARNEYHAQGAMKAVQEALDLWSGTDKYLTPRDEFIQQARDSAMVYYALVKEGQWNAKGEMGWFGMSDDSMTQAEWNRKFNELLDELPDDTLITIVDCHI